MKEAMRVFFERLVRAWEQTDSGLPRAPWDPDAQPFIWQSEPDENEWATWRPQEKTILHDLAEVAPDLGRLHPSINDYFNAWWFCALEGGAGEHSLSLNPVIPGLELQSFLRNARGYRQAHGNELTHVPIGMEGNGLLVVIHNGAGEVLLEDYERGQRDAVAPSLKELIGRLVV